VFIACLFVGASLADIAANQARTAGAATLFEGARLIVGDGRDPIESSAFLVEGNRIARVGKKGDVRAPAGATRVDLTGKTVIPALIDIHNHLGWTNLTTNQATKTSFTRELVVDHLRRYAYYGVAATLSMGLDRWDVNPDLPYQLRNEIIPGAARFRVTGGGAGVPPPRPWPGQRRTIVWAFRTERRPKTRAGRSSTS
jgi:imidazolonepropionase-like amidohydrolase